MRLLRLIPLLLPVAVVAAAWIHAQRRSDSLIVFGPRSWTQVVSTTGNSTVLLFSTISGGPRRAWSALVASESYVEGDFRPRATGRVDTTLAYVIGIELMTDGVMETHWGFGVKGNSVPLPLGAPGRSSVVLVIPFWLWLIAAMIPPAISLRKSIIHHRRQRRGCCLECGYDLRASPGRCPECGAKTGNAGQLPDDGKMSGITALTGLFVQVSPSHRADSAGKKSGNFAR